MSAKQVRRIPRRRRPSDDELLAPLPQYGTLPPAADWRAVVTPDPVAAAEAIVARAFDLVEHQAPPALDPLRRLTAPVAINEDELIDGTDPALRARIAGVVAGAVSLPTVIGLATPGDAATFPQHAGFAPVPTARVVLPAGVEQKSPYLPQVSCDPIIKPGVLAFEQFVLRTWNRGYSGGATRACGKGGLSEHKEGRAWDWMLNPNNYEDVVAGQRVIDWLLADDAVNARRVGIMYVIWNRRIWGVYESDQGWRHYGGPDPHYSHIHFSFGWNGAEKRTSWWTGQVAPIEYGPCRKYIGDPMPAYGHTINLKPCPKPKHRPKPKPKPPPGIPSPAAGKPGLKSTAPIIVQGTGKHRAPAAAVPASGPSHRPSSLPSSTPTVAPGTGGPATGPVAPIPAGDDRSVDRAPAIRPQHGPGEPGD